MKKTAALLLALLLLFSMSACGGKEAETKPIPTAPAAPTPVPIVGTYTLYAAAEDDLTLAASDLFDDEETLKLEDGGKAIMSMEGEENELNWTLDGSTLTLSDGTDSLTGTVKDGIITVEIEGLLLYYAAKDADVSGIKISTLDDILGSISEKDEDDNNGGKGNGKSGSNGSGLTVTGYTEGDTGDYHVAIVGAEPIKDWDDEPTIRFYIDFTNNSDESISASSAISEAVYQDNDEMDSTFVSDDVDEYYNDILYARPGVTVRYTREYKYNPDGGAVRIKLYDWWNDGDVVDATFDPANLPGVPAEAWTLAPIDEPTWTDELEWENSVGDFYVNIDTAELIDGAFDEYCARIYVIVTNNGEDAQMAPTCRVYQDGLQLSGTLALDSIDSDSLEYNEIEPSETVTISYVISLRNNDAVEVEISDWFSEEAVGGVFCIE